MWCEGCVGFWAHIPYLLSLLWIGRCLDKDPHLPVEPMLSVSVSMRLLFLPYHFIVPTIALPSFRFVLHRGLVGCRVNPLPCQFSAQGFPSPLFTFLPLLGFIGQHFCCTSPFHHFISRASLAHLLPLYLFYSHGFFARFFGLPRPNYHLFTFLYFLGLLAFKSTH